VSDRQLRKVHKRLQKARERLAAAEAELGVLGEQSDEDVVRALVSEGGLDRVEATESRKHSDRARREVELLRADIAALQRQLDDLLDQR
jgi:capsule polysaccharide export protein KpsE/RkpR